MNRLNKQIFQEIYTIPYRDKYIIYFPLNAIVLLGNAALVNIIHKAQSGDQQALKQLGIDQTIISDLKESRKKLQHLTHPQKPFPFAPKSVSLFLTTDCTLRCKYCYAEGGNSKTKMPWNMITRILNQILENILSARMTSMAVNFHGGGDVSAAWPLLVKTRDYLGKMCEPHKISVRTSVGINGILNPDQRKWIIENIDSATVSLDGPPEIHNFHRPCMDNSPSYDIVSETLKTFDSANYSYCIRTTVTSKSVSRLEEIIEHFCKQFKSRRIKVEPMFPRGRANSSDLQSPDAREFVKYFRKAHTIAKQANRELLYSGARLDVLTNVFCQAAGESCAVTPSGDVTSCYEVLSCHDPLSDIFFYGRYDVKAKRFVVDKDKRDRLFKLSVLHKPFCEKCFCKWHCAGDCPVKAIHAERNPSTDLPDRCYINKELTKIQLLESLGMENGRG